MEKQEQDSLSPEFAHALAKLRRDNGYSQRRAAEDLGVSQALLSHYENGLREPRFSFLIKACEYYGVSADYLLGRTDNSGAVCLTAGEERSRFILSMIEKQLQECADEKLRGAVWEHISHVLWRVLQMLRADADMFLDALVALEAAEISKSVSENVMKSPEVPDERLSETEAEINAEICKMKDFRLR